MKRIWIIGSSNVDLIMKVEDLPRIGETVTDGSFMQTFGGKGANAAVAAARAGGHVQFVNCVGNDIYAPAMVEAYRNEGIDVSAIHFAKDIHSGTALVMIGDEGNNYLTVAPGANNRLTPECIVALKSSLKQADRILLQCEIPLETNLKVLELAEEYSIPVILNLAPAREMPWGYLKKVDTLIVNESDAQFLSKAFSFEKKDDKSLAKELLVLGCKRVIVTLGQRGSVLADKAGVDVFPAKSTDVKDTTAAGDTFCGAFAVAMSEGKSPRDAVSFASAASAVCVSRIGAFPSLPRREAIDQVLADSGANAQR